jgi:hypothetical protein
LKVLCQGKNDRLLDHHALTVQALLEQVLLLLSYFAEG